MCSEKETVDISKGNAKMILILLVLCCLLKHATSIPAIDPQPLANLINGFMEKSLKHGEMQNYLDSLAQEDKYITPEDVAKITSLIDEKIEKRVNVVKYIWKTVQKSYHDSQNQPSVIPCCQVTGTEYDPRFKTNVNTNQMCFFAFEDSPRNRKFNTPDMLKVLQDNLEYLPSLKWQYFASEENVFFIYPAVNFPSCVVGDLFDYRLRPWYVQANSPQSKYVVVVIDTSGSMGTTENGVSLLDKAKTAARYVIATLNPHDKFAIVAFSSTTLVLGTVFGEADPCYSYLFAQAIPQNKEKAYRFIKQLTAKGGNSYSRALPKAYRFFLTEENLGAKADPSTKRVILMLSDGQSDDSLEAIYDTINFTINSFSPNNHTYTIMTYGLGSGDFSILRSLALENPIKSERGKFTVFNDMSIITKDVADFYKFFGEGNREIAVPIWTLPYQDGLGLDEVITGSMPVYVDNTLLGVIGIDIFTEELFAPAIFFKPNQFSYSFVIDGKGILIVHPILESLENDGTRYLKATSVERGSQFQLIYESMIRGENGSLTFNSTQYPDKDSRSLSLRDRSVDVSCTYKWTKIQQANYSIGFVLFDSGSYQNFSNVHSHANDSFFYHRLDLLPDDVEKCFHLSRTGIKGESSVFFSTRSFVDPEDYITSEYTADDIRSLTDYIEGSGANTLELKVEARQDSALTYRAYQLWLEDVDHSLQPYVVWRFIATRNGVFRIYPGVQLPKKYDPVASKWYESVLHDPSNNVVSTPYLDFQIQISIVTFARALIQKRKRKILGYYQEDVYAVMGVDLFLLEFFNLVQNLYRDWLASYNCKLYLLDRDGFVVLADEYITGGISEVAHLTKVEPQISTLLIAEKILVRDNCTLTHNGLLQRQYILTMEAVNYQNKLTESYGRCVEFSIASVPNSSLYILVRSSFSCQTIPAIVARSCVCNDKICTTTWENDDDDCECPCEDENPHYDTCKNVFQAESPYLCTRVVEQGVTIVPRVSFKPGTPLCYELLFEYSVSTFIPAILLISSLLLFSLTFLSAFLYYVKIRDEELKSNIRKEKIRHILAVKASNVEEYIKHLMKSDNDAARLALAKIAAFLYRLAQPSEVITNLEDSPYHPNYFTVNSHNKLIPSDIRFTKEASYIADSLSTLLFQVENREAKQHSSLFGVDEKPTKQSLQAPSTVLSQKSSSPEFQRRSIDLLKQLMTKSLLPKIPSEDAFSSLETFVNSVKKLTDLR